MTVLDSLTPYTQSRLCSWGVEIRGGGEWLGFPKINLLHRDHTRVEGVRKVSVSDETLITELIVNEINAEAPESATVLRAVYCGRGRWAEERRRAAERMLGRKLSRRKFFTIYEDGFCRVRQFFEFMLKAAA